MPPAALVSTITLQPAATAIRTPCTTVATGWPSYRWVRPRKTRTRNWPRRTERITPAWPGTVVLGNPPRSASGTSAAGPGAAGAKNHRDIVGGLAGELGQPLRAVRGGSVWVGSHALMYGFPSAAGARTLPTRPATAKIVATYGAMARM